jgi:hypothetical protein
MRSSASHVHPVVHSCSWCSFRSSPRLPCCFSREAREMLRARVGRCVPPASSRVCDCCATGASPSPPPRRRRDDPGAERVGARWFTQLNPSKEAAESHQQRRKRRAMTKTGAPRARWTSKCKRTAPPPMRHLEASAAAAAARQLPSGANGAIGGCARNNLTRAYRTRSWVDSPRGADRLCERGRAREQASEMTARGVRDWNASPKRETSVHSTNWLSLKSKYLVAFGTHRHITTKPFLRLPEALFFSFLKISSLAGI